MDHRTFDKATMVSGDDDDDGANSTNSLTPEGQKPKNETAAERKIRQKREEWDNKADEMAENNTKGMYLFYQFFMFISGLALFLVIVCLCLLIYNYIQILKAPPGEEGAQLINEGGQREKRRGYAHADLR